MNMKRMTAGLLALLILTSAACTGKGNPTDTEGTTDVGATEAPTETEAEESTTAPEDAVVTPPSVSLDQLTFTPASPEGQVLTEKGHSPQIIIRNYNETATDALGRVLPTSSEAGLPKEGKYVGLFYSLWTVGSTCDVDNSKVMAVNPYNPDFGPRWGFCWWTEPETGYHRGDDVWQIRRDLYYFAMAGIDFLYFDLTNGYLYEDAVEVFLDTCVQMRAEGQMTPYLVPWCFGTAIPGHGDTGRFYERFMTEEKYRDLWFHWEGKPLALVKCLDDGSFPILEDEYYQDKLTFRKAWVMPDARASKLYWCDNNIVNFGYGYGYTDKRTEAECAGIGCAGFANFGQGRSGSLSAKQYLDAFLETDTMGQGLVFEDSFNQLMKRNPECQVLLISRWNEWVAQNFTDPADRGTDTGFVDQFNAEFSRDIEPMKGGFTDNYFYQMCSIIRRFKGVLPADGASGANTMTETDGDVFERWETVCPVYTDFAGDTAHRDHADTTGKIRYVNTTGRNDIVESRITADGGNLYLYARAAKALTSCKDTNWMLLFIDADNDKTTGWESYDFLVNYEVISDTVTTLCAYKDGVWQEIGTVAYAAKGDRLTITIPRSLLGLTGDRVQVNFHWLDNLTDVYDLESWFTTGDSAPERRNNYAANLAIAYTGKGETVLPAREGDVIDGMPGLELSDEVKAELVEGLEMSFYLLPEKYPAQPDFRLIDTLWGGSTVVDGLTVEELPQNKDIAAVFEGYILVSESRLYEFDLSYGDGAKLFVDGRLVIDGSYDPADKTTEKSARGSMILSQGYHRIRVEYVECAGGDPRLALKGDWKFYCSAASNSKLSFTSDFASNATGIALGNTDLASFFTLGLNFSSKGTSASSYVLDGRSEMYTDLNGAYAMTYRFTEGCEDTWYAFVRGTHAVVAKDAPTPHVSSYYEKDGSAGGIGGAGIYARIEKGILKLVLKVYDRAAGTHIKNVSYEIPCSGTGLTLADSGSTVYVIVDGVTYATVELSGNVSYDVFGQVSPATGFAETAKITLKDGRTDTLTDTLIDSDCFTQGGLAVRAGTVCFDSVAVSAFSDAAIPEMETASESKE